jgi:hypothetical protein
MLYGSNWHDAEGHELLQNEAELDDQIPDLREDPLSAAFGSKHISLKQSVKIERQQLRDTQFGCAA